MTICDTGQAGSSVVRSNRRGFEMIDIVCPSLDNQHDLFISPPSFILFWVIDFQTLKATSFIFKLTLAVVFRAGRDCNIFVLACQRK